MSRKKKIIIFSVVLVMLIVAFDFLSYASSTRSYFNKITHLSASKQAYFDALGLFEDLNEQDGTTVLVIGDSVAGQMLESYHGTIGKYKVFPTNAAITMVGQYLYTKTYLENHPNATDVFILINSESMEGFSNPVLTYQYVVLPFILNGYETDLDELVNEKFKSYYWSLLLNKHVLGYIHESSLNRYLVMNGIKWYTDHFINIDYDPVSDISVDYLRKMYQLCEAEGVELHLVSVPLVDNEASHNRCEEIKKRFEESGLDELFSDYTDGFLFMDPELFLDDEVHFKPEYKQKVIMDDYLRLMIEDNESLAELKDLIDS